LPSGNIFLVEADAEEDLETPAVTALQRRGQMKILVINSGSSTIKCTLIEMPHRTTLATAVVERVGGQESFLAYDSDAGARKCACRAPDHAEALQVIIDMLTAGDLAVMSSLDEVSAVGHRIVHGGDKITSSVAVDESVLEAIRENSRFAPLHNPANLSGLEAAMKGLPDKLHVAVFDTAFHTTVPPRAHVYPVPYELYRDHRIRRYGFHGTSHRYVAARAAQMLPMPLERCNLITLHLGNGASATAVEGGSSVDTSMGFTPLEGLAMGTRCGDIDPALFYFLTAVLGMGTSEAYELLNRKSGLLGLSGISNDMRDILEAAAKDNERARLALDVFCYRVKKYIGAYAAVLGRVDAVVFTAGIGENCPEVRSRACEGLAPLGIQLDPERNQKAIATDALISTENSKTAVLVIATNEALMIADDTYRIYQRRKSSESAS